MFVRGSELWILEVEGDDAGTELRGIAEGLDLSVLLLPQDDHGVDSGGASGGYVAGQKSNTQENHGHQ